MRYLIGFVCVLALGVMGCSETSGARLCEGPGSCDDGDACTEDICVVDGEVCSYVPVTCNDYSDCTTDGCDSTVGCVQTGVADETPCAGGTCREGVCQLTSSALPCTDQGIRNAVAAGGGPYTFDCDVPTTVILEHDIIMEKDVALDGEGQLTVDVGGNEDVIQFGIEEGASVELRGMTVRHGGVNAIDNRGTLRLEDCLVTQAGARGVDNVGVLTLIRSTVADNQEEGVLSEGPTLIINSTVSGNRRGIEFEPLRIEGPVVVMSTTVARNSEAAIVTPLASQVTLSNSLVEGACVIEGDLVSGGDNIESPGDTCGFVNHSVAAEDLALGPLQDNGGPTETHALRDGSVAIDQIPAVDCVDADGEPLTTDQRGEPRDSMCDVGAFEVQP